jgi:hypothetical protein
MANEIRITSAGELSADDSADFAIKVVDQDGAVVATALTVNAETGVVHLGEGYTTDNAATLTPTAADEAGVNVIDPGVTQVRLGANVTAVTDFVTLPSLADVPNGHHITIIAGAANCEVRTPADSDEEINSENCDGTKEYLLTATQIHHFTKIDSTIGWEGHGYSAIGAVVAAVVPD